MKRLILPLALFLSFVCTSISIAQTDSLIIKPVKVAQCGYTLTLKNRNAAQQSIDELRLEIVTADGTQWYPATAPSGWMAPSQSDLLLVNFTIVSTLLAPGTEKSGFLIELDETTSLSFDKPISVKWTTLNGSQVVSTGFITLICTPFQSGDIDTATVVPMVSNNDPCFDFTLTNRNANFAPISRVILQLQTLGGGTMRPSKITPPANWRLDSVTALYAYFSALSSTSYIAQGESLSGFKVCLRGNPSVSNFSFNWFTYEEGGVLLGRDTVRNIPISFTGSAAEADSVSATPLANSCLFNMTVKNFHVSNSLPPSRIRKVALWANTPGLKFTGAPSAPTNWTRLVKPLGDSIIYTANHDSVSLPSSRVASEFRFSIDPPSNDPVSVGWRTYQTLTTPLSSGTMSLQCSEQPPMTDTATIASTDMCLWNLTVTNRHQPAASDLYGIEVSIPPGSGTLSVITGIGWTKTNETATSVRFVAPTGEQLKTGQNAIFSVQIAPQTSGADIVLTWKTFEEAGLQTNTALSTGTFTISCAPVVVLCDVISAASEGDTCMQNFTIKSQRNVPLVGVTIEPRNGWKINSASPPAGWDMQVDANKTLVAFTNTTGIAPDGSQSDFRVSFNAIDQADTFTVKVTTADVSPRTCDTTLSFTCTSGTSGGVDDIVFTPEQVNVVPNPVSHNATVELTINDQSWTTITLLDLLGRQVAEVSNRFMMVGTYKLPLAMSGLEAGTYYLRVQSAYGVVTKKVVLTN